MKLKKMHWFGIVSAGLLIIGNIIYFIIKMDFNLFLFLLGIGLVILFLPFIIGIVIENKKEDEIIDMFLEFSRNLAESVSIGTPVSKSITNMRTRNYGILSPYINKLANQISLGVPTGQAFQNFAQDLGSSEISRAIALIREAERAGGEIDYILESVAKSISEVNKLKKERRAAVYSLVVQGYIIFFIFIGIMLIMQFKIIPLTANIGSFGEFAVTNIVNDEIGDYSENSSFSAEVLSRPFLYLLITQGLLAGLTIGKLAEGKIKSGIKHSFILASAAFLISTGANLFLR